MLKMRERERERPGLYEGGGAASFMGVSLADAGRIIGFSQREGKCV